jgi:hypothetical protein
MGNIRHIARETSIPPVLEQGNFKEVAWQDFVRIMIPPAHARDEIIYANIVDTILTDQGGKVSQYIYTNSQGAMALKSAKSCAPKKIYEEFMKIASRLQPSKMDDEDMIVAGITNYGNSEPNFVERRTLKTMLESKQVQDAVLQCYVPSKGKGPSNRTYMTHYWLDRMAKEHMKTDILGINSQVSGSRREPKTANKDKTNNRLMEKTMEQLVMRMQRSLSGKVVQCDLEFVEDVNGAIWLSRMDRCLLAQEIAEPRNRSPSAEFKGNRIGKAAGFGDTSQKEAAKIEEGFGNSRPSSIGRHSDRRMARRWDSEAAPDEAAVQHILNTGSRQSSRGGGSRGRSRSGSRQSPSRGGTADRSPNRQASNKAADTFKVVGSRLDSEDPIAESTAMFGSTQLSGCQGDFCKFDLSYIENQELLSTEAPRGGALSEFRRKLLVTDNVVDDGGEGQLTEMIKGRGAASGSLKALGTIHNNDGDDSIIRKIAYRTIMQARQEMPLVKLQLQRHKRGEPGEYVTEQNYMDISVSMKLPAHYYKDVSCCLNCFKVYSIISEAREKAVNKLEAERKKADALRLDGDDGSITSVSGSTAALYTDSRASRQLQKRSQHGTFGKNLFSPVKTPPSKGPRDRSGAAGAGTGGSSYNPMDSLEDAQSFGGSSIGSGVTFADTRGMGMGMGMDGSGMGSYRGTIGSPTSLSDGPRPGLGARDDNAAVYLEAAVAAIDSLTKLDVAEIRTMVKPPAAVEVVLEAVMALLTGKSMTFSDTKRLLSGGEAFLVMLREFKLEDVTDTRLRLVEPYVDNPVFRPENVLNVSFSASKFCAWVLGVVQAARWQRGIGHRKTNFYQGDTTAAAGGGGSVASLQTITETGKMNMSRSVDSLGMAAKLGSSLEEGSVGSLDDSTNLTFVQKLEKRKAKQLRSRRDHSDLGSSITRSKKEMQKQGEAVRERSLSPDGKAPPTVKTTVASSSQKTRERSLSPDGKLTGNVIPMSPINAPKGGGKKVPGYASVKADSQKIMDESLAAENEIAEAAGGRTKMNARQQAAMAASQKKAANRLSSHNKTEGNLATVGQSKSFRCADGITKMPYTVLGNVSLEVKCVNFVVVHDFFDSSDATAIMFKQLVQRHGNLQVVCFNYPGQANTVWPRLPAQERARGAKEPILNNDWIADRIHELLQHAEEDGDVLLTNPFHLVGIGNGASIAASFCQRWGNDARYRDSLRALVSVNGFLYPDAQLSSILHSASQVFESTPHNRPDIPVSYWSRFIFSEEYLRRVNPNLALNIYTAVSNPITSDGRAKITRGCLQHRDLRGGLSPDHVPAAGTVTKAAGGPAIQPVQVPVIILQSTEDTLVSAANVDPFLAGRNTKHLWSHQLNIISESAQQHAADPNGGWVGKRATGTEDYSRYSILGKMGLNMLIDTLKNPRGAFVMWARSGHCVAQENKAAIMDLFDVLVQPTLEYTGLDQPAPGTVPAATKYDPSRPGKHLKDGAAAAGSNTDPDGVFDSSRAQEETKSTAKMEVLFKLQPPKSVVRKGATTSEEQPEPMTNKQEKPRFYIGDEPEPEPEAKISSPISSIDSKSTTADRPLTGPGEDEYSPVKGSIGVEPRAPGTPSAATIAAAAEAEAEATGFAEEEKQQYSAVSSDNAAGVLDAEPFAASSVLDSPGAQSTESAKQRQVGFNETLGSGVHTHPSFPGRIDEPTDAATVVSTDSPFDVSVEQEVAAAAASGDDNASTLSLMSLGLADESTDRMNAEEDEKARAEAAAAAQLAEEKQKQAELSPYKKKVQIEEAPPSEFAAPKELNLQKSVASYEQKAKKQWAAAVPDPEAAEQLEAQLAERQSEYQAMESAARDAKAREAAVAIARFEEEQNERRRQYEEEDRALLKKLEKELEDRRKERDAAERQRRLTIQNIEKELVSSGIVESASVGADGAGSPNKITAGASIANNSSITSMPGGVEAGASIGTLGTLAEDPTERDPIEELPPMRYDDPSDLPQTITDGMNKDVNFQIQQMVADEEAARKRGHMSMEDYDRVKQQMAARQLERDQKLRALGDDEQEELFEVSCRLIQRMGRGLTGRQKARRAREIAELKRMRNKAVLKCQAIGRGYLGRQRFARLQRIYQLNLLQGASVIAIQSVYRGHVARKYFRRVRRFLKAREVQRIFRGHLGRLAAAREKYRLTILRKKNEASARIQSTWRMKVAREEFRSLRIHVLAVIEIQRTYRGYLGRKQFARRRQWEAAAPGPDRVKLGLQLIEESKVAFERQQEEIDALHRAQERAEARVSHIHAEMQDAEKELSVLERELSEIDQIERDLQTLSHEKDLLLEGISDAAGMPRNAENGHSELVMGVESTAGNDPDLARRRRAEAYALEMTIQIKRAEREKKRQELETEFAVVFQEVEKKKRALERLEAALSDMEATRERKDREFRRLQKNLMQLLLEQKQELDDLREKGIELETATAMTAAAATATALKAKEHEKRSEQMFGQTEELMKFQFMSMSLSYFSSLNMLKSLRDMNSETTSAAVASSADAAAAAAASAAAANLPDMKKMDLGANDFLDLSVQKKKQELQASNEAEAEAKKARANPMPENVKLWSVNDVCRWLDALFLGQYSSSFREAAVDGQFLMELREEDMVQVLGIKHKLHVRKIMVSREKLKPMTEAEKARAAAVEREEIAEAARDQMGVPDAETVFVQARNSRTKKVEDSLNLGFKVDTEDDRGNTLLVLACQNSNKRLAEMLLIRGANVNHQNAQGNTPLHYALAFDTEGQLGEYLIEHGADDTMENIDGLTPYDGLAA